MSEAHWAKGPSRMGFTTVYVVDEHGCLLNTEPACSVPDRYGDWFMSWLMTQPCPHPSTGVFDLLHHQPVRSGGEPADTSSAAIADGEG